MHLKNLISIIMYAGGSVMVIKSIKEHRSKSFIIIIITVHNLVM